MNSSDKQPNYKLIIGIGVVMLVIFATLGIALIGMINSTPFIKPPTATPLPTGAVPLTVAQQLDQIDSALKESLSGSIVYNLPNTIKLDETATIELLLTPSLTPNALATQVAESIQVVTGSIDITPRMKAVLIAQDDGLLVKPLEENPEQLISDTDTTKWTWFVTAKKSGSHKFTLVVYRLINYEGKDYWRQVESYSANIEVEVTLGQRIMMLDWKWIAGILITLLIVPAFWRWMDNKNKKGKKKNK